MGVKSLKIVMFTPLSFASTEIHSKMKNKYLVSTWLLKKKNMKYLKFKIRPRLIDDFWKD